MNIADIIKLSVGGYTKDQIKEMNTLTKDCPELLDFATKQGKTFDEVKELFDFSKELDGGTQTPPTPEPDPDAGKSDQTADLEKKIQELTKQNEELNNKVTTLQSQNLHTNQGGTQPDFIGETLGQIVASYM